NQQRACDALEPLFLRAAFKVKRSDSIQQQMWEKWMLLATLASITCLMRGNIGAIAKTQHGTGIIKSLLNEAGIIATSAGFAPRPKFLQETSTLLTDPASPMTSSMLRDIEKGIAIEADHIVGDLVRCGQRKDIATPLLNLALTHLNVYEERRRNWSLKSG
ncbi:MAG: ketopantoate reductase C-terminal domain-containing protein, partial [Steroidobacter sp.]